MRREPGHLAHRITERLIAGGQRLQREHLTALLRAHGNPICDRVTQELIHRLRVHALPDQIAVLGNCSLRCSTSCIHAVVGIAFQQALPFQEASDALCEPRKKLALEQHIGRGQLLANSQQGINVDPQFIG